MRRISMRPARWLVPALAALAVLAVIAVMWLQRPGAPGNDVGVAGGDAGQGSPPYAGSSPGDDPVPEPDKPDPLEPPPGGEPGAGDGDVDVDVDAGMIAATGYHVYDATHLAVVYTNGVPECYGAAGTPRVEEAADAVTVTIPRTPPTSDGDTACIDIALVDSLDITLDAPLGDRLVRDGSRDGAKLPLESLPNEDPAV